MKDSYINIKEIAEAKGLKSTRSLRLEINKPESKYQSVQIAWLIKHITTLKLYV